MWRTGLSIACYNARFSCISTTSRFSSIVSSRKMSTDVEKYSEQHATAQVEMSKPMKNTPFAKELFLGKFDKRMLVFPEVLETHEIKDLEMMVNSVEQFYLNEVDSAALDRDAVIPDKILNQLKEFGLFGQQIPAKYGGLELNATQYARMAEFTSLDPGIGVTLAAHQAIGLKGILIAGTDAQKEKYLPTLATGEKIAAFALTEPSSGSDAASIQTRATLSEDGQSYRLNGGKIWITNGGIADVFTVFAKTQVTDKDGEVKDKITAFIVERGFGGVTNGKPEDKLGIRCSNTCQVFFEDTPVPIENVLGDVGGGFKVAMNILNSGRFSMGSSLAGSLRHLMKLTIEHALERKQFGKSLSEFGLIQEKMAHMAVYTYVMESMAFSTAGTLDMFQQPDASVEAAMVKVFSSEYAWTLVSESLQVLGGLGYMKEYPYERCLRDARICLIFEGTNEILRMYIALTCLQHAGVELKEIVDKLKDPLNNMGFLLKTGLSRTLKQEKRPFKLKDQVHPNLSKEADNLEAHTLEFGQIVERYLTKYRNKIGEEQMIVSRMADIAIEIYAQTCTIARASRSICIGLKNCDHEIKIAQTFCKESQGKIAYHLYSLKIGRFKNGDDNLKEIAEKVFENGGYVAEHPLTRVWK